MKLANIKAGGKRSVAEALTLVETEPFCERTVDLLEEAYGVSKGHVIGITGPPGSGKSTLIDALIAIWRTAGLTVAVLAVDPSSRATRGALLGDRVRMRTDPSDDGVFVRSVAARERLGGLSDTSFSSVTLMRALFDRVVVESVGVGQSETDIENVSDTVVLCIQPGSGDSLQFMKAGIVEIPDIAIVTKADIGAAARRALADLEGALGLGHRGGDAFAPLCLAVSATAASGLDAFMNALDLHGVWLRSNDRLVSQRRNQARQWLRTEVAAEFGRRGVERAAASFPGLFDATAPFRSARDLRHGLDITVNRGS